MEVQDLEDVGSRTGGSGLATTGKNNRRRPAKIVDVDQEGRKRSSS
jgi:hypothetical protein